jgi:hypothetical protein
MRRTGLGVLFLLSFYFFPVLVCAQDNSHERENLNPTEISRFLGTWEGTFEQIKKNQLVSRNVRIDVTSVEEGGFQATVFVGPLKPNVGMLGTKPPSEKDCRVKFANKDGVPSMRIKLGQWHYEFVLLGDELHGECTSAEERRFSLFRPK